MTSGSGFTRLGQAEGLPKRAFLPRSGLPGAGAVGAGVFGPGRLAACGSGASGAGSDLSVYNWGHADEGKLYDQGLGTFAKSHGGIAVQDSVVPVTLWGDYVDKLVIEAADGKAPDLIDIAMEGTRLAASKNLLTPLSRYLGTGGAHALLARMPQVLKAAFTVGGKRYGVPNEWQTMAIYYNTKIFVQRRGPAPALDWRWDDFLRTAQKLAVGGVMGFGLPRGFFQLHPWWLTNGTYPVTADYSEPNLGYRDGPGRMGVATGGSFGVLDAWTVDGRAVINQGAE
jgi:multiple sugar transport system substrate-binding protein